MWQQDPGLFCLFCYVPPLKWAAWIRYTFPSMWLWTRASQMLSPKEAPPLPQFLLYNRHLWYSKGKLTETVIYNIYFFPWNLNMFSGCLDISIWKGFVCDCLRFFCFVCRMKNTSKLHRKSLRSPGGRPLSPLLTSESSAWWCKKPGLCLSSFYGSLTGVTPREKTHAFTRGKSLL